MEGYVVGKILNTHGLKGDLKIKVLSDSNRFFKGSVLHIEHKKEFIEVEVLSQKSYDNHLLVRFKNLEDINLVEKYKNSFIWIDKDNLTELDEEEFYYHELVGLPVYNQNNELRGNVSSVREVPQGHLLVIEINGKSKFIPFRKEFVTEVTKDKVIINEIEGLL